MLLKISVAFSLLVSLNAIAFSKSVNSSSAIIIEFCMLAYNKITLPTKYDK